MRPHRVTMSRPCSGGSWLGGIKVLPGGATAQPRAFVATLATAMERRRGPSSSRKMTRCQGKLIPLDDKIPQDPKVMEILNRYLAKIEKKAA